LCYNIKMNKFILGLDISTSKIGFSIVDENKNLIGIAKLATPVKKTEERDITFKLKLDF